MASGSAIGRSCVAGACPPHSVEAEGALLAAVLADNSAWDWLSGVLTESDFYRPEHRLIYRAMGCLIMANAFADAVTVRDYLRRHSPSSETGHVACLATLVQKSPRIEKRNVYAQIVRDCAIRRELIRAGDKIIQNAKAPQGRSVQRLLDEAEQAIFSIGEANANARLGFESIEGLVDHVSGNLQDIKRRFHWGSDDISGLRTGFSELDSRINGLGSGELVVIASRSPADASTLALKIVEHVSLREQLSVAMFTWRLSGADIVRHLACSISGIDSHRLDAGRMNGEDWLGAEAALAKLRDAPLHVHCRPGMTALNVRAEARRLARKTTGVNLVVVNSLEGLRPSVEQEGTDSESIAGCRVLKLLAQELQCPVVVLTQSPKTPAIDVCNLPQIEDHLQAMAVGEVADVVLLLRRIAPDGMTSKGRGEAYELIVSKPGHCFTDVVQIDLKNSPARFRSGSEQDSGPSPGVDSDPASPY